MGGELQRRGEEGERSKRSVLKNRGEKREERERKGTNY